LTVFFQDQDQKIAAFGSSYGGGRCDELSLPLPPFKDCLP
jgi:hypothetical protein